MLKRMRNSFEVIDCTKYLDVVSERGPVWRLRDAVSYEKENQESPQKGS